MEIRSAGKREEQIRDIPASVIILTREEIQRYGWVTFEELLRSVPGFFILDTTDMMGVDQLAGLVPGMPFATNDLFAEVAWTPIERLRLVGGARLSRLPSSDSYRGLR